MSVEVNSCFLRNSGKRYKSVRSHPQTDFFLKLSTVVKTGFRQSVHMLYSSLLASAARQQSSAQFSDVPSPTWETLGSLPSGTVPGLGNGHQNKNPQCFSHLCISAAFPLAGNSTH